MAGVLDVLVGPLAGLLDKLIPDPKARDAAKLELMRLERTQELELVKAQLSAVVAEAQSSDPWTSRARPGFLYLMYLLVLCALPMGVLAAFSPGMAAAVTRGMTTYLQSIPEELYALFGTGYLGYTAARTYGKVKGVER